MASIILPLLQSKENNLKLDIKYLLILIKGNLIIFIKIYD